MISTDQSVSFDLALSEQGALMRTAPLEGSEPGPGPQHHDVYPVRRDGEGTGAFEFIQIGYANKRTDLHGFRIIRRASALEQRAARGQPSGDR